MATKIINKKLIKIVSATSMAIFSLLATMTSAYAWFVSIMNQGAENDNFYVKRLDTPVTSISIHEFYGETKDGNSFTFNPVGVSVYENGEVVQNAAAVELNEYSLENPNHPVLILFRNEETSGLESQINLITDFSFLGANDDYIAAKLKNKAALNSLSKTNGNYYQVTTDESQAGTLSNKIVLYKYENDTLSCVTYSTFSALEAAVSQDIANNNNYYRVYADENHDGVSTVYQYRHATREFEMVWCDLGNADYSQTNPLSSAVQFHYFTFEDELEDMITTEDVMVESFNDTTSTYSYTENSSLDCIALAKSGFTASNKSSFTNFTDEETFDYSKTLNVFSGDVTGVTYVGIVVNYDQLSLEYIFSHNLGHDALNAGLDFKCDWITEF